MSSCACAVGSSAASGQMNERPRLWLSVGGGAERGYERDQHSRQCGSCREGYTPAVGLGERQPDFQVGLRRLAVRSSPTRHSTPGPCPTTSSGVWLGSAIRDRYPTHLEAVISRKAFPTVPRRGGRRTTGRTPARRWGAS